MFSTLQSCLAWKDQVFLFLTFFEALIAASFKRRGFVWHSFIVCYHSTNWEKRKRWETTWPSSFCSDLDSRRRVGQVRHIIYVFYLIAWSSVYKNKSRQLCYFMQLFHLTTPLNSKCSKSLSRNTSQHSITTFDNGMSINWILEHKCPLLILIW